MRLQAQRVSISRAAIRLSAHASRSKEVQASDQFTTSSLVQSIRSITNWKERVEKGKYSRKAFIGTLKYRNKARPVQFARNIVQTTKYNVWDALPKNLMEQFRRKANLYFLVVSLLQITTNLSPTSKFSTILPFATVLLVSLLKDFYEDYVRFVLRLYCWTLSIAIEQKRHLADHEVNSRICRVVSNGHCHTVQWRDLEVGDIIEIRCNEQVPVDVAILSIHNLETECFIETSNLDGEMHLKKKNALSSTSTKTSLTELSKIEGMMETDGPSGNLHEFSGRITENNGKSWDLIELDNMLWRGAVLKNTHALYGVVVFTGPDTRIARNSLDVPFKRSRIDANIDTAILVISYALVILCFTSTMLHIEWVRANIGARSYLTFLKDDSLVDRGLTFVTFLILYNNLVPVSLYVSFEIVKFLQARMIARDVLMYDPSTDTPTTARTSSLNEDLGQIRYIFADKTGTLTCNKMQFRKCWTNGSVFFMRGKTLVKMRARNTTTGNENSVRASVSTSNSTDTLSMVEQDSPQTVLESIDESSTESVSFDERDRKCIRELAIALALCHTVSNEAIVRRVKNQPDPPPAYVGSSPDEIALVKAARDLGIEFVESSTDQMIIKIDGEPKCFDLLNINAFSSQRKKMSVVVRDREANRYLVICKGADDVLVDFLNIDKALDESQQWLLQLNRFAREGLRTLVVAQKEISKADYLRWNRAYQDASSSIMDRTHRLGEAASMIERDLEFLGFTGTEDELQAGVPKAIEALQEARIKLWMVTGDKLATALNIGIACRLIREGMEVLQVDEPSARRTTMRLAQHMHRYKSQLGNECENLALAVTSTSLMHIVADVELHEMFLVLAMMSSAVIACRCTPFQKAELVRMVKFSNSRQPLTLAVGDGANDVPMLQEAHVGVGIHGNEGTQAVRASDFSIAQFQFLRRLLLIHGYWNYQRVSMVVLYSLYKNIALVFSLFFYATSNGFSGTSLYESFLASGWNLSFTTFPILALGVLDQCLPVSMLKKNPILYAEARADVLFTLETTLRWIGTAVLHSATVYFLSSAIFENQIISSDGRAQGIYVEGTMINFCILLTVTYKLALETNYWTIWNLAAISLSIGSWFLFTGAYSELLVLSTEFYGVGRRLFGSSSLSFFFTLLLVPLVPVVGELVMNWIRRVHYPKLVEVLREQSLLMNPSYLDPPRTLPPSANVSALKPLVNDDDDEGELDTKAIVYLDHVKGLIEGSGLDRKELAIHEKRLKHHEAKSEVSQGPTERTKLHPITSAFVENHILERIYLSEHVDKSISFTRKVAVLMYILLVVYLGVSFTLQEPNSIVRLVFTCLAGILLVFVFTVEYAENFFAFNAGVLISVGILRTLLVTVNGSLGVSLFAIVIFLTVRTRFWHAMVIWLVDFSVYLSYAVATNRISASDELAQFLILHILIVSVAAHASRRAEIAQRNNFVMQRKFNAERERTQDILDNMLPPHINRRMMAGDPADTNFAEGIDEVSVFFCDVQNMAKLLSIFSPPEMVSILDSIYSMLDELCRRYYVQKVETVGKTYMACAGTEGTRKDHALAVTEMGMKIVELIERSKVGISVRVGINSGRVLCGVVGVIRPQFCLVGDTVNTASRMQSTGLINRVNISESTYNLVRTQFKCDSRTVEAKGKGELTVYVVVKSLNHGTQQVPKLVDMADDSQIVDIKTYINCMSVVRDTNELEFVSLKRISLRYTDNEQLERVYREDSHCRLPYEAFRIMLLIVSAYAVFWVTDEASNAGASKSDRMIGTSEGVLFLCTLIAYWLLRHNKYKQPLQGISGSTMIMCLYVAQLILAFSAVFIDKVDHSVIAAHYSILAMTVVCNSDAIRVVFAMVFCAATVLSWVIMMTITYFSSPVMILFHAFFVVCGATLNIISAYGREMYARREFVLTERWKDQHNQAEKFLYSMLPPSVAHKLKCGVLGIASEYKNVTMMYSDFQGFTKFASSATPEQVIRLLSEVFTYFDELTRVNETYKVQTIGDAYVMLGGVPFVHPNITDPNVLATTGAINVVTAALLMVQNLKHVRTHDGNHIRMRVGVHTGTIIGGCIGTTKFRYDIWGKDCAVANDLESEGKPDHVCVSSTTAALLGGMFDLEPYETPSIRKTTLNTFIVHEKDPIKN